MKFKKYENKIPDNRATQNNYIIYFPGQWTFHSDLQCGGLAWKTPSNHLYFQLGNGLLLLAFLSPNSLAGMLWLRCVLSVGCVLLVMWGWLIECSIDIVLWFGLFLIINLLHSIVLIVRLRPIKFDREIEAVSECVI